MTTLNEQGKKLIKSFEGLRLNAYRDSAGIWTIGYGSTHYHDGRAVRPGDKLANEFEADTLFSNTLCFYEAAVNRCTKVPLNQNQFDALVSFTYNTGTGALAKSALLQKLNLKLYNDAADQFLAWNKITDPATGEKIVLATLTKRREQERRLFLTPDIQTIK